MELTGWGKYPRTDAQVIRPVSARDIAEIRADDATPVIARGMGRSYGDSSLSARVIDTRSLDYFVSFDDSSGILTCAAGVTLADILQVFVPKGWFLPVTPGTRFITVGGAIASDVHGKNHHIEGSFCDHILSFTLATAGRGVVHCSRESQPELFTATCGGMGLTGIILEATFKMRPISSAYIEQTTLKAANLGEALALFDAHASATYSVAWIDCLASGSRLGRALLSLGQHARHGELRPGTAPGPGIPFDMPAAMLNRYSVAAFNALYYSRVRKAGNKALVHYQPFFYPLDGISHWNRLYGRRGFLQYQFVLPRSAGPEPLAAILKRIADSGKGSFLAVLKTFGRGNDNLLSFPIEGYTLALDFKMDNSVLPLLNELDAMVSSYSGRIYLAKDARMSESTFKKGYPAWEKFRKIRQEWGADNLFHSLQSRRLGL